MKKKKDFLDDHFILITPDNKQSTGIDALEKLGITPKKVYDKIKKLKQPKKRGNVWK